MDIFCGLKFSAHIVWNGEDKCQNHWICTFFLAGGGGVGGLFFAMPRSMQDLNVWPVLPAMEAQSPNYWTAKKHFIFY